VRPKRLAGDIGKLIKLPRFTGTRRARAAPGSVTRRKSQPVAPKLLAQVQYDHFTGTGELELVGSGDVSLCLTRVH
jgi:hypothetical protein